MISEIQPAFTSRIAMSYDTAVKLNDLPNKKKEAIYKQLNMLENNGHNDIVEIVYNDKVIPYDVLELRIHEHKNDKNSSSLIHLIPLPLIGKSNKYDKSILEGYSIQKMYVKPAQENNKFMKYV